MILEVYGIFYVLSPKNQKRKTNGNEEMCMMSMTCGRSILCEHFMFFLQHTDIDTHTPYTHIKCAVGMNALYRIEQQINFK